EETIINDSRRKIDFCIRTEGDTKEFYHSDSNNALEETSIFGLQFAQISRIIYMFTSLIITYVVALEGQLIGVD
ncbi:888_t:CDS:2, partial [Funneliformis mosseae]